MRVEHHFEGGIGRPYRTEGDAVTFDLAEGGGVMHVRISGYGAPLRITLLVGGKQENMLMGQGLIVSRDGYHYEPVALEKEADGRLSVVMDDPGEALWAATRYPYGASALAGLAMHVAGGHAAGVRLLRKDRRTVPVFEFGHDDGHKMVHYFIGGEDAWETAGCITADAMARLLASNGTPACEMLDHSVIRVIPLLSAYSASQPGSSYTTMEGESIYGAATWGDLDPPPEYSLVRDEITGLIKAKRLGLMLTLHSWQGGNPNSVIETIRSAGHRRLEGHRREWAATVLETLIRGVPKGHAEFPEKIWHPGLARDYLLAEYGAITFRAEVTTHGQGRKGFYETARVFLANVTKVADWKPVCP